LALAGIAWDISGAIALSRGWFFVSDERLKAQTGSAWGANPAAGRSSAETRLDTRFGLGQLLVGFVLQFAAAAGFAIPFTITLLALGVIALAWAVYLHNYPYWIVRDGLRLSICPGAAESTWREYYEDVPDRIWRLVLCNEGIEFEHITPPRH
jgi:hypothetical protein